MKHHVDRRLGDFTFPTEYPTNIPINVSTVISPCVYYVPCGGVMNGLGRCDLCGCRIECSTGRCASMVEVK